MTSNTLQPTSWLAKRLGLSVSTIERLRSRNEGDLPPYLVVGRRTIRYDEAAVDTWLAARQGQARERSDAAARVAPSGATMPGTAKKKLFGKRLVTSSAIGEIVRPGSSAAKSCQGGHNVAS